MFKPNNQHTQQSLFASTNWMDPKIKEKLLNSWAPYFYENVFSKIDEEPFSALYGTTGNPNFPINIMLSLEYIKHMKGYSDTELLDHFYFDYLVNYAVGMRTLGEINLSERTLYYFRERVYQYCLENPLQEDLIFGQFMNLLEEFKNLSNIKFEEQRTDTTMFMSNIKKSGRMSLAYDVLKKAVKVISKENLTDTLSKVLEPKFKTDALYLAKDDAWDSKLEELLNLCNEAYGILLQDKQLAISDEARIIKRFIEEQSTFDAENKKVIPKKKTDLKSSSLQSAYDEDATFRIKGKTKQSGYVLEISETCGKENDFQLITDYVVAPNIISDVELLEARLEKIHTETGCTDMYVDGGFHSETVHNKANENGINIHLTNMSGTEPKKKIAVSAYEIDEETNLILKCPNKITPLRASVKSGQTIAHFPIEACESCEFKDTCQSKKQKKQCVVRINLKAIETNRERSKMKSARKENTSMRAAIEGSISGLKRTGLSKLKVRGKNKCSIAGGLIVTAQNIKRMIKYLQGGYVSKKVEMPTKGLVCPI